MKKIMLMSCIIILLFSLTACISGAERKKGKANVKEGKKLIKEYVRETYGEDTKASAFKPAYIWEPYNLGGLRRRKSMKRNIHQKGFKYFNNK